MLVHQEDKTRQWTVTDCQKQFYFINFHLNQNCFLIKKLSSSCSFSMWLFRFHTPYLFVQDPSLWPSSPIRFEEARRETVRNWGKINYDPLLHDREVCRTSGSKAILYFIYFFSYWEWVFKQTTLGWTYFCCPAAYLERSFWFLCVSLPIVLCAHLCLIIHTLRICFFSLPLLFQLGLRDHVRYVCLYVWSQWNSLCMGRESLGSYLYKEMLLNMIRPVV